MSVPPVCVRWFPLLAVAGVCLVAGCRDASEAKEDAVSGKRSASARGDRQPPASPAEAARRLQALHSVRQYAALADLIVAEQRAGFMGALKAVDRVLAADGAVRSAVHTQYGAWVNPIVDLRALTNDLGPLSAKITLIGQRFEGDCAIVTLQQADRVPLVHATFVRQDGGWRYVPEPIPHRMAASLDRLAGALEDLAVAVSSGLSYRAYARRTFYEVFPQMNNAAIAMKGSTRELAAADGP